MLRIAVQKSGRLKDDSIALFKECGIDFEIGPTALKTQAYNFPVELLFLRDDDIPTSVESGVASAGIVGENVLEEKGSKVDKLIGLGFGKCRLSLAVPKGVVINGLSDLQGQRVATSYPNILLRYVQSKKIQISIQELSGSVEIAPSIGLADAICDLVSSGSTLASNGLRELEVVMQSQAVLIGSKALTDEERKILQKLIFRIEAVRKAKHTKYLLLNAPNSALEQIKAISPGLKSPTIIPLQNEGWSSVHTVIQEDDFWEVIDKLKALGAEGILVVPIEKMIK
jgi:ATP phosphoribosyltransferase